MLYAKFFLIWTLMLTMLAPCAVYAEVEESEDSLAPKTVTGDLNLPAPFNRLDCGAKYIALTFDDGPHKTNTPRLLDALSEYGAKATFFVVGHRTEDFPEIVERMSEEGHSVGSHTYNHKQLTLLSSKDIRCQLESANEAITGITGKEVTLLRPPFGAVNSAVTKIVKEKGMAIALWNVDPKDWNTKNAQNVADHVIKRAKAGDIILLHDMYKSSVDAALIIVKELTEQGFVFVTVDELIEMDIGFTSGATYNNARSKVINK